MQKIKINPKMIALISKEIIKFSKKKISPSINSVEDLILYLKKKKTLRSKVFDALNMMPVIGHVNYLMYKVFEKKFSDSFLNWTYPQVRIDLNTNLAFKSPAHVDKWILSPNKKGYIFWFPINENGGKLIFFEKNNWGRVTRHPYWGLNSLTKEKGNLFVINHGEGVIFDKNTLHKSDIDTSQVSVQFRYEIFKNFNGYRRSVTQKTDIKVLDYWKKKYESKK